MMPTAPITPTPPTPPAPPENEGQKVAAQPERVRRSSWQDYAIRFVFGGLITAITGLIAHNFGPVIGGLFLAFPAILPASATLIEQHSGKEQSQADISGSAIGAIALLAFGLVVWLLAGRLAAWLVLLLAFVAWLALATGLWAVVRRHPAFQKASKGQ